MKRTILTVAAILIAGVAQAADVVVTVRITVEDAARVELKNMIDADEGTFPPLYSNLITVVNGVTNTERVVVSETLKKQMARLSGAVLENYWRRQLTRYRQTTQPTPVVTAPVTVVEEP